MGWRRQSGTLHFDGGDSIAISAPLITIAGVVQDGYKHYQVHLTAGERGGDITDDYVEVYPSRCRERDLPAYSSNCICNGGLREVL